MQPKTELNDRVLWFDGVNEVLADLVPRLLLMETPVNRIVVREPNEDVNLFNLINDEQIENSKTDIAQLDMSWNIPPQYRDMDLSAHMAKTLEQFSLDKNLDNSEYLTYSSRLNDELRIIRQHDVESLFKTLVYVVDTFRRDGIVWGVGRGSSCASLVLFLIGLHKVDPIKFGIPLSEFFHS